jgi:cell division protein FtsI/penicillin-binding protein 2
LNAEDAFKRYLAAGLTAHLTIQSLLIIAGNIRMLPLTGVTLPFVSYGGSSLLTSYLSLLLLLHISRTSERGFSTLIIDTPYRQLGTWLMLGLGTAGLIIGWWAIYRAPGLIIRTDNPRRSISDRFVRRGSLLSRGEEVISESILEAGVYQRVYRYPDLGALAGYSHPIYGQSGLESSVDEYLRGTSGNPITSVWWNRLLYGTPPPGLDVRLSLDLNLQRVADSLLAGHKGALVLLNAESGEILIMASHPSFNANELEENWEKLVVDEGAPLLDRSAFGQYPIGPATGPFLLALVNEKNDLPALPSLLEYNLDRFSFRCTS